MDEYFPCAGNENTGKCQNTHCQLRSHRMNDYHARRALGVRRLENGETEGLDPREMPRSLLEKIGHKPAPILAVIRAKCLDCSHNSSEVRKCTAVDCALWPYRMGTNPLRAERSAEQLAASKAAGERLAAIAAERRKVEDEHANA
jgi:hypothetical protein